MTRLGGKVMSEDTDTDDLGNVDNTSDANKPVSTAQQAALNLKTDKTSTSNVDNTSDANKPVSTAQQAALNIMTKVEFNAQRESDKSRFNGSGEDNTIDFGTAYAFPATVANQFTIEATVKYIDGIRCVMPQTVMTLPEAPDGLDKSDGTGRFTDLAAAVTAGGTGLTTSIITRQDLVLARITLSNYSGSNVAVEQNPDSNIYADAGTLKQYTASYIVEQGLRDYTDLSDAMTAFGYTLDATDKGLWTDGTDLFIPIALVQRRNQGFGDGTLNLKGCKLASDGLFWYNTTTVFTTTADCFDITKLTTASGAIGQTSGRWNNDGKFYDAIDSSDVQDLRMSVRKVPYEELHEKYKHMATAGELRGVEGVPFSRVHEQPLPASVFQNPNYTLYYPSGTFNQEVLGLPIVGPGNPGTERSGWMYSRTSGTIAGVLGFAPSDNDYIGLVDGTPLPPSGEVWDIIVETKQLHSQANPTWTDIIGSPANIAATFPEGVEGQWLPTIPDGIVDTFELTRPTELIHSAERSTDNGATWVSFTPTLNTVTNAITLTNEPSANIVLVHYKAKASPEYVTSTAALLDKSLQVFATNDNTLADFVYALNANIATGTESEYLTVQSVKNNLVTHTTKTVDITTGALAAFGIGSANSQYYLVVWDDVAGVLDYDNAAQMVRLPFFTGEA